ncbi:hypothetical protein V3C99_014765 [Haemonchus contortus]
MIECVNGMWLVTQIEEGTPQEITGIVCNVMGARDVKRKPKRDAPTVGIRPRHAIAHSEDLTPAVSEKDAPVCSLCSTPATHAIDQHSCPSNFHCSEARIERKFNVSTGCQYLTVECPGKEMQVLLEAGKLKTIYSESVRCDGEWTFVDDNHSAQRIVNMMCLDEAPQIGGDCSCSKLLRTQLCKDGTCEETAVDFSPDGCIAKFSCEKGFQLEISRVSRERKNGVAEVRKQFIVEDSPALTCSGGRWVYTTSGESVGLLNEEFLSCKAPLQPSLHLLEHEV